MSALLKHVHAIFWHEMPVRRFGFSLKTLLFRAKYQYKSLDIISRVVVKQSHYFLPLLAVLCLLMQATAVALLVFFAQLSRIQCFSRPSVRARIHLFASDQETSPTITIPSSDVVADDLGVRRGSRAPRRIWRYSWRLHGYMLPLLHALDRARSKDLDYSLKCLWCKALSGLDPSSPTFDGGLAYDMLPSGTRWILRLPNRIFPRLIHFNIELRTAYLNRAIREEVERYPTKKIRLITFGAGYDTRSVRCLMEGQVHEAWEIDMAPVVASKEIMLDRLRQRRHSIMERPNLLALNLNNLDALREILQSVLDSKRGKDWHTIFLFEGVLIYLDRDVPKTLLTCCSSMLRTDGLSGSLVFADLFRDLTRFDNDSAAEFFQSVGWDLMRSTWCVKPGLARHMGVARLNSM